MPRRPLKIGFLGPVLDSSSGHARSISRAIAVVQSRLPAFAEGHAELLVQDDGASAAGGETGARMLLERKPDIVAGLFSSDAAAAATPLLTAHDIEVVIAGANLDSLTAAEGVFRICDTASDYAAWIARVIDRLAPCSFAIHAEPSHFGQSIGRRLAAARRSDDRCHAQAAACIGQFQFVEQLVREETVTLAPGDTLLLTDDCQSDHKVQAIAELLPGVEILVAGFCRRPALGRSWARDAAFRRWGKEPAAFFHETIAAIETATHIAEHGPPIGPVGTVFGDLVFDASGEAHPQRMVLYHSTARGLVECPLEPDAS